jgi:hypothetical protein
MIRSKHLSAFAIAAILGAAPAFADDSAKSGDASTATQGMTQEHASTDRLPANRAGGDRDRDDRSASTASGLKPLCSSLKNPNAGKLADKDTGEAKEHSASPVHEDCIPDSTSSLTPSTSGSTSSTTSNATTSNMAVKGANQPSAMDNPATMPIQSSGADQASTTK